MGDDTWHAFDQAITEREKAGETHITEVKAIHAISIDAAELKGTVAHDHGADRLGSGEHDARPVGPGLTGTDAVTEITDLWTFERDLAQRPNPIWHLVAARSA